jgi:hypothetical protein
MGDDEKSTPGGEIDDISSELLHKGEEKRIGYSNYPEVTCQCETFMEEIQRKEKVGECSQSKTTRNAIMIASRNCQVPIDVGHLMREKQIR